MAEANQDRIEKIVELRAPVSRVWRALTDHVEFGSWFRVQLDGPFRVGVVNKGKITYPGYEHMVWESRTEKLEPERLFVFSWPPGTVDPDHSYDPEAKVLVEFHLEPSRTGTRLTIIESGFLQFHESKRLEVLRMNRQGWDMQADNIAAHVAD